MVAGKICQNRLGNLAKALIHVKMALEGQNLYQISLGDLEQKNFCLKSALGLVKSLKIPSEWAWKLHEVPNLPLEAIKGQETSKDSKRINKNAKKLSISRHFCLSRQKITEKFKI